MANPNEIGQRGESIFSVKISKDFLLIPSFLGDKYRTVDFIVNLTNTPKQNSFFFVSVKTMNKPKYNMKQNRLKISIPVDQLTELKKIKIPVYIVGIDENKEEGFIVSLKGIKKKSISSIPTTFPISQKDQLLALWKEVKTYWDNTNDSKSFKTKFLYK